jgi:hypothetical protein
MVVNPYSVLAAFVALLEGVLALVLLVAAVRAWRPRVATEDAAVRAAEVGSVLGWLAFVLVGLALASWPLLYLLFESQVPLWPGVMCVQGVLAVGRDATGAAALLPGLATALQVTKPALVFVAGLWLVLHLVDRATRTGPLRRVLLATLCFLSLLALADAAAQTAYLAIPKETAPDGGCCTLHAVAADDPPAALSALAPGARRILLLVTHLALGLVLVVGTSVWAARDGGTPYRAPRGSSVLALAAALSLPVGAAFLAQVAAPALLGRPEHRCPFCVLAEAPETWVGIGLFFLGAFSVLWAALLSWIARPSEAGTAMGEVVRTLVSTGRFGYAGATLFAAVALAIA